MMRTPEDYAEWYEGYGTEEDLPELVQIADFFVDKNLLDMKYDCDYTKCNAVCCRNGCYITAEERDVIAEKVQEIAEYLRERPELPFWGDAEDHWEFTDPVPVEDDMLHTRVAGDSCVFQIPDGRCAIHSYCLDHGISWETFKFEVCVVWPIQFRRRDGAWVVRMHKELPEPYWDEVDCVHIDRLPQEQRDTLPFAIDSMKSTIVSRIGQKRYDALKAYLDECHANQKEE